MCYIRNMLQLSIVRVTLMRNLIKRTVENFEIINPISKENNLSTRVYGSFYFLKIILFAD